MQINRDEKSFSLVLFTPERVLLERILSVILTNYTRQPGELHPRGAAAWYPAGVENREAESVEDRDFWAEELQGYRSENAGICRHWLQLVQQPPEQDPLIVRVSVEQSEVFMQVLNDHRIYLAACQGITEQDMEVNWSKVWDPSKRQALLEIHFLAVILEGMLQSGASEV